MNTIKLNTIGTPCKSGGGGTPINNQENSVDITENGTTEIVADEGFTGLSKVGINVAIPNEEKTIEIIENGTTEVVADNGYLSKVSVNVNVPTSGGGSNAAILPKRDGRTHIYIQIEETTVKKDITLYFYDSSGNSLVDWGDGSEPMQVTTVTGNSISHTYASGGYYEVTIYGSNTLKCSANPASSNSEYSRAAVYAIEAGSNITEVSIMEYPCLKDLYIINSGSVQLQNCTSLRDGHIMMEGVVKLKQLRRITALSYFKPVSSIESFGSFCFDSLLSLYCLDFSDYKAVPIAEGRLLNNMSWGLIKVVVPDNLYDEWISATNWSSDASIIIKKSEWDAQNS